MPDDPRVTVVWCDFGGVLTPPIDEAAASVAAATGVPWSVLRTAIGRVADEQGLSGLGPLELGRMTQREWGARVTAQLPPGTTPRVSLGTWGDHWYRDRVIDGELLSELRRVSAQGVAVGMLTNSVAEWEPHRARMLGGDYGIFAAVVRSHELGLAKPDPAIFEHADAVLPPGVGQALLIDDGADNCAAAHRWGWQSIHHGDPGRTIGMLRRMFPVDPAC